MFLNLMYSYTLGSNKVTKWYQVFPSLKQALCGVRQCAGTSVPCTHILEKTQQLHVTAAAAVIYGIYIYRIPETLLVACQHPCPSPHLTPTLCQCHWPYILVTSHFSSCLHNIDTATVPEHPFVLPQHKHESSNVNWWSHNYLPGSIA